MRSLKHLQPANWHIELNETLYNAQITRTKPSALIFMIDQSASMGYGTQSHKGEMKTAAQIVADMINDMLNEIISRCTKAEGVRDYFDVCVLGYGGTNNTDADILWEGNLKDKEWVSLSELKANAMYENREVVKKIRGVEKKTCLDLPYWFKPMAKYGTPMGAAFEKAHSLLCGWIKKDGHEDSYPPVVINITDGGQTDCQANILINGAQKVQALNTRDGHVLVLNCHISNTSDSILFPLKKEELPGDSYSLSLFEMSSVMPNIFNADMANIRQDADIFSDYRGMGYNVNMNALFNMIDIGTTGATKQITGR